MNGLWIITMDYIYGLKLWIIAMDITITHYYSLMLYSFIHYYTYGFYYQIEPFIIIHGI
jgi:hypothetical protein